MSGFSIRGSTNKLLRPFTKGSEIDLSFTTDSTVLLGGLRRISKFSFITNSKVGSLFMLASNVPAGRGSEEIFNECLHLYSLNLTLVTYHQPVACIPHRDRKLAVIKSIHLYFISKTQWLCRSKPLLPAISRVFAGKNKGLGKTKEKLAHSGIQALLTLLVE